MEPALFARRVERLVSAVATGETHIRHWIDGGRPVRCRLAYSDTHGHLVSLVNRSPGLRSSREWAVQRAEEPPENRSDGWRGRDKVADEWTGLFQDRGGAVRESDPASRFNRQGGSGCDVLLVFRDEDPGDVGSAGGDESKLVGHEPSGDGCERLTGTAFPIASPDFGAGGEDDSV